jgi:hypothetical protein
MESEMFVWSVVVMQCEGMRPFAMQMEELSAMDGWTSHSLEENN